MIKINIFNMKEFLETVNQCVGEVNILQPDGRKENINKQYGIQNMLLQKHRNNDRYLKLSLDIPTPEDYMNIVFFTIGDC